MTDNNLIMDEAESLDNRRRAVELTAKFRQFFIRGRKANSNQVLDLHSSKEDKSGVSDDG